MLIDCPHCGARPSEEFTILGDATKERPSSSRSSDMESWFDYVYHPRQSQGPASANIGIIPAAAAPGWWSSAIR